MSIPMHQLKNESDGRPGETDGGGSYTPGITVVVPTNGGCELVRDLLASLAVAGERIAEPWEVIVVDDTPAPHDATVAEICQAHDAKYMRGPWRVGSKRSLGAAAARFDIVLFVDSDCRASPELLLEHLRSHRTHGPEVGAAVGPTEMFGDMPFVWRVAHHAREYNVPFAWPKLYREVPWGTGSNFSFRHAVFSEIGGYDEDTITVNGGEDVDVGIRACENGYRIISNPKAVVFHTRENITQFRQIARKVFRYGRADIYLCLRHPKRVVWHFNPLAVPLPHPRRCYQLGLLAGPASAHNCPNRFPASLGTRDAATSTPTTGRRVCRQGGSLCPAGLEFRRGQSLRGTPPTASLPRLPTLLLP